MNIREHVEEIQSNYSDFETPPWDDLLFKLGYYRVRLTPNAISLWPKLHIWCGEHIGEDHYTWVGYTFWFENDRDAVLFSLKWL